MEHPKINSGKWRIPQLNPWKWEWVTLQKIGRKTCILGTRAEADRDLVLHCNIGKVQLIQSGLGKHWGRFSLVNYLLIAIQLD